jgi:branched-chain amino acid transport system permease protein
VTLFLQQLANGIVLGATYALIALGYTMVYGIIQLINFAHGEIYMLGGFGGLLTYSLVVPDGTPTVVALLIVLVGAMVTSVAFALAMERLAYRPLRNAPRLAPLITAIGVSLFLQEMVSLFYPVDADSPGDLLSLSRGTWSGAKSGQSFPSLVPGAPLKIGGVQISRADLVVVLSAIFFMVALTTFVRATRTGKAMQATAQDPDTARLMGINTDRTIVTAFVLGAILAAVAGVAQGVQINIIDFKMGFTAGIKAFTAAVLGGIGNIAGAVLGGFTIGIVETMAIQYVDKVPGFEQLGGGAWKNVWAFVVLIVVLVFRPSGLLGERVASRS